MAALGGGAVALLLGIVGISIWWQYFLKGLAAAVPVLLILGGALAIYLGYEEIKDKKNSKAFDETSNLKDEIRALKDEIKDIKGKKESGEAA